MPEPWIDYLPPRKLNKEFYDLRLRDGTVIPSCWPDGAHFTRFHTHEFYADYRILQIRRGNNPWEQLEIQLQKTLLGPSIALACRGERGKAK
jgi:hypothetical protein